MAEILRSHYALIVNEFSGVIDNLRTPEEPESVNFAHKDAVSGFGSLSVSSKGVPWRKEPSGSPLGVESYRLDETRFCARLERVSGDEYYFFNRRSGHRSLYRFQEKFFDLEVEGSMPDADQVALDLNLAMLDSRQNDPQSSQFTLKSFYTASDGALVYAVFQRYRSDFCILVSSLKNCVGWRLRYNDSPVIDGFQMIHRFSEQIVPEMRAGSAFHFGVRVSFHRSFEAVRDFLRDHEQLPLIDAPFRSAPVGEEIRFDISGEAETLLLRSADGAELALDSRARSLRLPGEGFFVLKATNRFGKSHEAVFHGSAPYLDMIGRERRALQPFFRLFNAEVFGSWVQAMTLARQWLGPETRMESYLHDALTLVGMQGRPGDAFPGKIPDPDSSRERMERRSPRHPNHYPTDGVFLSGAPAPREFEFDGIRFPAAHIYKSHRIQDGFAFVQTYLYAARAFGCDAYYQYAVEIARAHLDAHLAASGALERFSPAENMMIDYTTVVCPLMSVAELCLEMEARSDARSAFFREACIRIADYLVRRGVRFFPTEGVPVHRRWSSDGTVASTALSLLAAYRMIEPKPEYLETAERVLKLHEAWRFRTDDARSDESTYRYWETQWENDGEGHSLNCGHAWSLERAEALFLHGEATGSADDFRQSYTAFQTNLCNHHPDGRNSSCFTPDAIPARPARLELYRCYPRSADHAMSFYVWSRIQHSWLKTAVLYEDARFGPVVLNGALEAANGRWSVRSFAPLGKRLINLTGREAVVV